MGAKTDAKTQKAETVEVNMESVKLEQVEKVEKKAPKKEADEILVTNTGVKINITAAIKDPADAEKTICILCNHIDEVDAEQKKVVAELKGVISETTRKLKSSEEDTTRHLKRALDETSVRMRAERKIVELEKKLEENETRNLKQKKKIQELENMNRALKKEQEESVLRIKKEREERERKAAEEAAVAAGGPE